MANRNRRLIGVTLVAIIAVGSLYLAYDFWQQRHSPLSQIILYGNIDIREADLGFSVPGRVESMLVEEGDEVTKGQLLAQLEADIYRAELDSAKAQVGVQTAVLDRLLAGSRPEEIKEARANVQAIKVDLQNARVDLQRTELLTADDFATLKKRDDDRARVHNLEARLNAAQQVLALAIKGPRREDIAAARAQLRASEADLALAQRRMEYTQLRAKDHGVVKVRIVEPGTVVLANSPVYTVALIDPVWVRTYVSEPDLGKVRPGMRAEVTTDSAPGKVYESWVGFVSPVAEFTPKTVETPEVRTALVYRLRVYVKNPDDELRQGMPATVRLTPESAEGKAEKSASQ